MNPIAALAVALVAGVATFAMQSTFLDHEARAAPFVPTGPDWRSELLARDPGQAGMERTLDRMTAHLSLTPDQANKLRPILQQGHDRIEKLLLTAPPTLTREQFLAAGRAIRADTRKQADALLNEDQRELAAEFRGPLPG